MTGWVSAPTTPVVGAMVSLVLGVGLPIIGSVVICWPRIRRWWRQPSRRVMRRVDRLEAKLQLSCGCRLPHAPSLRGRSGMIQTLDCTQGHGGRCPECGGFGLNRTPNLFMSPDLHIKVYCWCPAGQALEELEDY